MNDKLVTVKICSNIMEAGIVQSYLESEGILTFLQDSVMTTIYGGVGAFGGIKLQVMKKDEEFALQKLKEGGFADES